MDADGIDGVEELLAAVLLRLELQVLRLAANNSEPIDSVRGHQSCGPHRLRKTHETAEHLHESYSMPCRKRAQCCGSDLDGAPFRVSRYDF